METDERLSGYKPADLLRWDQALRRLGPDMVRMRLDERARPGARDDQVVPGLVAEPPHPPALFVERWLRGEAMTAIDKRGMLPAIGVGAVLLVLCFLTFWQVSAAIQSTAGTAGTPPSINTVMGSGGVSIGQVYPGPGAPTTGTQAAPVLAPGATSN
ncbi:MAG TPA: hypothetical protein VHY76_15195 [Acetobacteraceae bacterium]|jgi:hypothetical protein|nr:hypothetical protein [Acetobacteraceae bacterium]